MTQLRIGLTGGIASGKSQVAQLFAKLCIDVIDADKIARELFNMDSPLLLKLKQKFGETIFNKDNSLNRKALGKVVFNSPKALSWLNQLTHPTISKTIKEQLKASTSAYVVLDIPLLIDKSGDISAHLKPLIDRVLVINTSLDNQLSRLCSRDQISLSDANNIISKQSSLSQKLALADDVIDNNAAQEKLAPQVAKLNQFYLTLVAQVKA